MSIKTKKISDLTTKTISGASDTNNIYLVGSNKEGVAYKIALSDLTNMISSVAETLTTAAISTIDTTSSLAEIVSDIDALKNVDKNTGAKMLDIESRIKDLITKSNSNAKAISDLSNDVVQNITSISNSLKKFEEFFKTIAIEEKLTLAKIQEAAKSASPTE